MLCFAVFGHIVRHRVGWAEKPPPAQIFNFFTSFPQKIPFFQKVSFRVIISPMIKPINKESLLKIGEFLLQGMTETEACILCDVTQENLTRLKEKNEDVRHFIEKNKVMFKYSHLKELQSKRSDKTSQWLLERLRSEDFNISQRSKHPTTVNVIGTMIAQIQQDDGNRLVRLGPVSGEESDGTRLLSANPRERLN